MAITSILLVDDDEGTRQVLATVLAFEGYRVWTAGDVEEAWNILAQRTPDLLIVDLLLPNTNGDELRQRQLTQPRLRQTRFILMTAALEGAAVADAIRADAFLEKPIDADAIVKRVHDVTTMR